MVTAEGLPPRSTDSKGRGVLDYLKPSECHYTIDNIVWVLNYCIGGWPSQPSGYIDIPLSKTINSQMPHQSEIDVLNEIGWRLSFCGKEGQRFYDIFRIREEKQSELGKKNIELPPIDYDRDIKWDEGLKAVIHYISGNCRRIQDCKNCLSKVDKNGTIICKRFGRKPCTWAQWVNHNR